MIIRICVWVLPEGAVGGVGVAGDDLCCLHLKHGRQPGVEHHVRPLLAVLHSRVTLYVDKKYFFVLSTKIFGNLAGGEGGGPEAAAERGQLEVGVARADAAQGQEGVL